MAKKEKEKFGRYDILGKDSALSYKFVGGRYRDEYYSRGWVVCKKEEHPNLKVYGDRNSDSKTGLFEVGPYILMCISADTIRELKDDLAKRNKLSEGIVAGDGEVKPLTIDITQNR